MRFISTVIEGFLASNPLFSMIPRTSTEHSGPTRNIRGTTPLDQNMSAMKFTTTMSLDAIRDTNIEEHTYFLYRLANENIQAFSAEFYKGLTEITNATRNIADAGGKPFSFDHLNDAIEKMQIDFDESGEPILPTMVMHPQLYEVIKDIKLTPEQEQRNAKILERKKAEFYAKKRTRRLS